jgi:hypothetical protein
VAQQEARELTHAFLAVGDLVRCRSPLGQFQQTAGVARLHRKLELVEAARQCDRPARLTGVGDHLDQLLCGVVRPRDHVASRTPRPATSLHSPAGKAAA